LIDANGIRSGREKAFAAPHWKARRTERTPVGGYCEAGRANLRQQVQYQQTSEKAVTMALGLLTLKLWAGISVTGNGFKRSGDTLRYLQAIENDRLERAG